jgi:hypothetical protein
VADEGIGPNFFDALHESAYGTELECAPGAGQFEVSDLTG